jgi:hypothetical protein
MVFPKFLLRSYSSSAISAAAIAADDGQDFARYVARTLGRGQKDIGRSDFFGLRFIGVSAPTC